MSDLKIRGGRADVNLECSGSLVPTSTPHNPNTVEARDGHANHYALAFVARCEEPPVDTIAETYEVDADDLARTVASGRKAWSEIVRWFPNVVTEAKVEGPVTIGIADVLCDEKNALAILDWKTGYSGDEHKHQLMAYADAARETYGMPSCGYIPAFEVWLKLGEYQTHNFTEAQLDGFRERCREQIKRAQSDNRQYSAGPHCKFCQRQMQCIARDEYLRATTYALVEAQQPTAAITRETLGGLYERSKLLHKALAEYDKLLDAELADGPIDLGDGRVLRLKDVEQEAINNAGSALHIISQLGVIDDSVMLAELSITKSAIERACKASAAKGGAAALVRKVLGELRDKGIASKKTIKRKEIVNV